MSEHRSWELNEPKCNIDGYNHVHAEFIKSTHETPAFKVTALEFHGGFGLDIVIDSLDRSLLFEMAAINMSN